MDTIKKLQKSKVMFWIICVGIFAIMFVCNMLTNMCVDDYAYSLSWATKEKITNVFQIFPSIAEHRNSMNGRLIAHFFVQFFLLMPPIIFKLLNPLMFLAQILLMYRICKKENERNNFLIIIIFCLIWVFEPAFGQVNLWLDGSCNYLWSAVFGLLYLIPLSDKLQGREFKFNIRSKVLYVILGFVVGGYLENISVAIILMDIAFLLLFRFYKKEKLQWHYIASLVAAIVSCFLMSTAPGEIKNKLHNGGLSFYRENFIGTIGMFKLFWVLAAFFVILFVIALSLKVSRDKIIVSCLFVLGSLCCNFIFIIASYYPQRSAFCSVLFLIVADCILLADVFDSKYNLLFLSSIGIFMIITIYYGVIGMDDIYITHTQMSKNEQYIAECKKNGITDIELQMIKPTTKYSAVQGLKYLDTEDKTSWPNDSICIYFGINSIIGK